MIRVLVSACLLGHPVRYNGASAAQGDAVLTRWLREGRVVPFCPEVAAGLGVPRPAAEIVGGGGGAVIDHQASIVTEGGADVTARFLDGAYATLQIAMAQNVRLAVLKDGSPSCGSESIHDGTFQGRRVAGQGVTTALLERHGVRVFSELQLADASDYLDRLRRA